MHTETSRQQQLDNKTLAIHCVVPVHNEADNITAFLAELHKKLASITQNYRIILVDDGSSDNSVELASEYLAQSHLQILSFSRNFGKEAALTAGLAHASGDVCIIIDADFQHPIDTIDQFLSRWVEGYDMVYGTRECRRNESFLKRSFSRLFYGLMSSITKVSIPANAGDFRLLDRKAVEAMNQLPERERFMKGLYAWIGFNRIAVPFTVQNRRSGISSFRFTHLFELALVGITSFSNIPLRVWSILGAIISFIAFVYGIMIVCDTLFTGVDIPGYATITVAIMFFGGIQLLSVGILGEYIARIFSEVKQRPTYVIAKKQGIDDE